MHRGRSMQTSRTKGKPRTLDCELQKTATTPSRLGRKLKPSLMLLHHLDMGHYLLSRMILHHVQEIYTHFQVLWSEHEGRKTTVEHCCGTLPTSGNMHEVPNLDGKHVKPLAEWFATLVAAAILYFVRAHCETIWHGQQSVIHALNGYWKSLQITCFYKEWGSYDML